MSAALLWMLGSISNADAGAAPVWLLNPGPFFIWLGLILAFAAVVMCFVLFYRDAQRRIRRSRSSHTKEANLASNNAWRSFDQGGNVGRRVTDIENTVERLKRAFEEQFGAPEIGSAVPAAVDKGFRTGALPGSAEEAAHALATPTEPRQTDGTTPEEPAPPETAEPPPIPAADASEQQPVGAPAQPAAGAAIDPLRREIHEIAARLDRIDAAQETPHAAAGTGGTETHGRNMEERINDLSAKLDALGRAGGPNSHGSLADILTQIASELGKQQAESLGGASSGGAPAVAFGAAETALGQLRDHLKGITGGAACAADVDETTAKLKRTVTGGREPEGPPSLTDFLKEHFAARPGQFDVTTALGKYAEAVYRSFAGAEVRQGASQETSERNVRNGIEDHLLPLIAKIEKLPGAAGDAALRKTVKDVYAGFQIHTMPTEENVDAYDPDKHQVAEYVDAGLPQNRIVTVVQEGLELSGNILRKAQVKVQQ